MTFRFLSTIALAVCLPALTSLACFGESPDGEGGSPRKVLDGHLSNVLKGTRGISLAPLEAADECTRSFEGRHFFVLRFEKYPVEIVPPDGFKSSTLFVVAGKAITRITSEKELEAFFKQHLLAADKCAVTDAAKCWLRLAAELNNDGSFNFKPPTVDASTETTATGTIEVRPERGNKGTLSVELHFAQGKLQQVKPGGKLLPGIRPRCQATRLLDPDPVIREIMRRDLLVMGSGCRAYLQRVRTTSSAELRQAIDDVWQQIQDEGR